MDKKELLAIKLFIARLITEEQLRKILNLKRE